MHPCERSMIDLKRVIITIIFIAALICFGYSAFSLGKYAWQTHVTKENISVLSGMVKKDADGGNTAGDTDTRTDAEKMMDKYDTVYHYKNLEKGTYYIRVYDSNVLQWK